MLRSICTLAALVVVAAANSGCLVLAVTIIYVATQDGETGPSLNEDGQLQATLPYPIDVTRLAAEQTLEANGMRTDTRSTGDSAHAVHARYGDGLDIDIELTAPTPYSTLVSIRVGPEGHLERSIHLMETIAEFAEPAK